MRNYPAYFGALRDRLRPGGRLLNHCITRADNRAPHRSGAFIDRYVFPDGELAGPGRLVSEVHDAGFEVHHEENLRAALRADPGRLVPQPRRALGLLRRRGGRRAPPGCGASTWPGRGWRSSATASSCTRCWPPATARTA